MKLIVVNVEESMLREIILYDKGIVSHVSICLHCNEAAVIINNNKDSNYKVSDHHYHICPKCITLITDKNKLVLEGLKYDNKTGKAILSRRSMIIHRNSEDSQVIEILKHEEFEPLYQEYLKRVN